MSDVERGETTVTSSPATWPLYQTTRLLTLADWDALPEDSAVRVELVEGVPLVMNAPVPRHQQVLVELIVQLRAAGLLVLPEVGLIIDDGAGGPATARIPDLVVARPSALDGRKRLRPDDVIAVIEILSLGTRRTDRVAKLAEYAEVGIAHYVIVDPDGPIHEFLLDDGAYRLAAEHTGTATLAMGATITL